MLRKGKMDNTKNKMGMSRGVKKFTYFFTFLFIALAIFSSFSQAAVSRTTTSVQFRIGYCGDGICNIGETYETCPADCPAPEEEEIPISEEEAEAIRMGYVETSTILAQHALEMIALIQQDIIEAQSQLTEIIPDKSEIIDELNVYDDLAETYDILEDFKTAIADILESKSTETQKRDQITDIYRTALSLRETTIANAEITETKIIEDDDVVIEGLEELNIKLDTIIRVVSLTYLDAHTKTIIFVKKSFRNAEGIDLNYVTITQHIPRLPDISYVYKGDYKIIEPELVSWYYETFEKDSVKEIKFFLLKEVPLDEVQTKSTVAIEKLPPEEEVVKKPLEITGLTIMEAISRFKEAAPVIIALALGVIAIMIILSRKHIEHKRRKRH